MVGYLYDTHVHTSIGSACGRSTGPEYVKMYSECGYAGIIITDHFFGGNTAIDRDLPWADWVHNYCQGYNEAKIAGDACGFNVMFGWEQSFDGTDFLIYGLDEQWLVEHPEIARASIEEQFQLVNDANGLVVQAHPFRQASYIKEERTFPNLVHGVEVFNVANEQYDITYNQKALQYAKKYGLPMTEGSDIHHIKSNHGGMCFDEPLTDIHDYVKKIKGGKGYHLLSSSS